MQSETKWILLLYELPTTKSSERVNLWRRLKKFGALSLKTSAYLLPDSPGHLERFQWLAQQIRDGGGEATLIRVSEIENLSAGAVIALFNEARASDYQELISSLRELLKHNRKRRSESFSTELEKLRARFGELREIDFFDSPRAHDVETLLQSAEKSGAGKSAAAPPLSAKDYTGKTWLTRPRPEIDRVGSAWLIRNFIDSEAKFVFGSSPRKSAIPYDMLDVEFTHHGEDCTFETLLKSFRIEDKAVRILGEMIHDADLEDDKFRRADCVGLQRMFIGWAKLGLSDHEILEKGFGCFDALKASIPRA